MSSKLHKNRYLICLYEQDDETVAGIFSNCEELAQWCNRDPHTVRTHISHFNTDENRQLFFNYKVHLIDCYETHNDIFVEEDKKFLDWLKQLIDQEKSEYRQKFWEQ